MGGKRQALGGMDMLGGGQQQMLKMLVANKSAGSIIGKAGSTINAIKEQSGARIKVRATNTGNPSFLALVCGE